MTVSTRRLALAAACTAAVLAGCSSVPETPAESPPVVVAPPAAEPPPVVAEPPARRLSHADSPRAYRRDAAGHVYAQNAERIWKGRMPPLLYAVGVLQVEVGRDGQVERVDWMRAPRHAPEVIAEIERTVRAAAPYPVPARMGRVVWTDTWLWHRSGRFQLDTLTEGQD